MPKRRGMYDAMVRHSSNLWTVWPDGLVSHGTARPTRDELIEGFMSIPVLTVTRDANGKRVRSERMYATRAQAERAAAPYAPSETEAAA